MKNDPRSILGGLATAVILAAPLPALPFPSLYDANCAACHGTTTAGGTQTCAGCHAHGTHPDDSKSSINVSGVTGKTSYAPGEMVTVTINGGYRSGWIRTILYDQNLHELARSTGTVLPGFFAPSGGPGFPVTLTAPAPTTPGNYTWWVAWYGHQFDGGGAAFGPNWTPSTSNGGHGEERVQTNSFTVVAASNPVVALNPPSLSFGTVNVGATSALTTQVQNAGTAALNVTAIALCSGTSAEFTWSPAAPVTVAAGAATTLTVTFAPTNADTDSGCIALQTNDPANPTVNLQVSGTGALPAAPSIALSPSSLSFGSVTVGTTATLTTQVQDTGTAPLNVTSITPCSGASPAFSASPAAPFTVAAGGSTTLSVTYTPTTTAGDSGCFAIASNDPANPTVQLLLSGNGAAPSVPAIAFSPATLAFGTVTIGSHPTLTAQVQNTGGAPLNVTSVALCSGTSTEFTFSPAGPFTVAPGASAPLQVTYTPTDVDAENGCLAVSSNDPARPVANLALTAQGAAAATPAIAVSPANVDFGSVAVGSSRAMPVQVQDTGGAPLNVTAIAACSGTSGEFTWSPAAPFTVAAGQSATLTITYAPVDAGADNGCLTLTSNDPANPSITVGVAGTGTTSPAFPAIALEPSSLDFGMVNVGGSMSRTSSVKNTGTAPLDVTGVSTCSGTSPEFTVSPTSPFTVAPGDQATLTVTYMPADAGTDTGCVAVASNDPMNAVVNLELTGTGVSQPVSAVDIDIDELEVPESIHPARNRSITPVLEAENHGRTDGAAPARLVATLDGQQVYDQTITVTLAAGEECDFPFPAYAVARGATGTLRWTVTIADGDPDVDQAMARTRLGRGGGGDHGGMATGPTGPTGASGPTGNSVPPVHSGGSTAGIPPSQASAMGCGTGSAGDLSLVTLLAAGLGLRLRRRPAPRAG